MFLDFNAFKMIKSDNSLDDYEAGQGGSGNFGSSVVEKGKRYREEIKAAIKLNGKQTAAELSVYLDSPIKTVRSILQKLEREGAIIKAGKVVGKNKRPSFVYVINEA